MPCQRTRICQVQTLPRKPSRAELETQMIEAQAKLQFTRQDPDGARSAILARHGSFEVRLVQSLHISPESAVLFWLELFDCDRQLSIDSIGDCVFEEAVTAASDLIQRATRLSKNPHSWRRSN
jgi:hypothetical protein